MMEQTGDLSSRAAACLWRARKFVLPDRFVWVVIGDRAKIESGIKELNLGDIVLLDADGRPKNPTP
jgi:hypothetical protein